VEPPVLERIPRDTFYDFGHHVFPSLIATGASIWGWEMKEGFLIDIGTPATYAQVRNGMNSSATETT
jgi:NDP-sugar pyrophosphorylase family protein